MSSLDQFFNNEQNNTMKSKIQELKKIIRKYKKFLLIAALFFSFNTSTRQKKAKNFRSSC
jgi:hypothetical protein